jgi:hypothetical protein
MLLLLLLLLLACIAVSEGITNARALSRRVVITVGGCWLAEAALVAPTAAAAAAAPVELSAEYHDAAPLLASVAKPGHTHARRQTATSALSGRVLCFSMPFVNALKLDSSKPVRHLDGCCCCCCCLSVLLRRKLASLDAAGTIPAAAAAAATAAGLFNPCIAAVTSLTASAVNLARPVIVW